MVFGAALAVKEFMRAQLKHALPAGKQLPVLYEHFRPPVAPLAANLAFHEDPA
jgi:hypothetical protein